MAPMKPNNNHRSSSNYYAGEEGADAVHQANILASCYVVDPSASSLKGLHYCTTGVTGAECPPSSPPLAAINTATNELALTPKARSARQHASSGRHGNPRQQSQQQQQLHRRGGATSRIRGECERFFCETLRATFLGERDDAPRVSRLTDVYHHNDNDYNNNNNNNSHHYYNHDNNHDTSYDGAQGGASGRAVVDANGQLTPPDYFPIGEHMAAAHDRRMSSSSYNNTPSSVALWLEIWDYAGGNSFRAFVAEDYREEEGGARSLFVFFDANSVAGRDLKQALVALIELAEGPLGCSHMVLCIDRSLEEGQEDESREEGEGEGQLKSLLTGLRWAGFELTTLDFWARKVDVTSSKWLFMGMEV